MVLWRGAGREAELFDESASPSPLFDVPGALQMLHTTWIHGAKRTRIHMGQYAPTHDNYKLPHASCSKPVFEA